MRRLHLQFYLAILATIAVFLVASVVFWRLSVPWREDVRHVEAAAQVAGTLLPPADANRERQQLALEGLHRQLRSHVALYDAEGNPLAAAGRIPELGSERLQERSGWTFSRRGPLLIVPLEDGRRLVLRPMHHPDPHGWRLVILPLSIVLAFALGAYPIARRLTGRLARLQAGVEQLGQGRLNARVRVEGRDEIAALARSFNDSAARIEELVKTHKILLANCSHELRTPLARLSLAIDRLSRGPDPAAHQETARSIAELDALIEEMLLASRLDALKAPERQQEEDLLALAAEEATQFDLEAFGQPVTVTGDAQLLRRMIRNLLDNARRHAGDATRIEVGAEAGGRAVLIVEDGGEGVAEADRERIFEPFQRAAGGPASARGAGLGLSIVRQIARAHGGDVRYEPLPGGGSRFVVSLPSASGS
jgi:signal transduction histidine kinase